MRISPIHKNKYKNLSTAFIPDRTFASRLKNRLMLPLLVALVVLLTSCETSRPQRAAVPAPPAPPTLSAPAPAVQEAVVTPVSAVASQPVNAELNRAEKAYQLGLANYNAGHLEAAKVDFDKAVDALLGGQVNIKSDERLQSEFDKIIEGVHNLEMAALKTGDGFTEQKAEPAPIDEANDIRYPVDPAIKARAAAEVSLMPSDLPLVMNDLVASYVNYFSTRGRGTFERAYRRSGRYKDMIHRVFQQENIPLDLIYLAQAESGFHPLALSRVGARGMWQFMAYTAPGYGLQRNWWVDDREDPEKATHAAARFLKELHHQFGDWYLAMAAYNSGAGTVQRAVQRTGYADFWELYRRDALPAETKNYVPIILAVTIISKNPGQYGFDNLVPDVSRNPDRVIVSYPIDLRLVAECVDATADTLAELNPSLVRMTTPKEGEFELKLPAGTAATYLRAVAAIPVDKRVSWRYHRTSSGDTLESLARKYRTTAGAIAEANNIDQSDGELTQAKLVIPMSPVSMRAPAQTVTLSKRASKYRVRRGDTLLSVADHFGVPAEQVRRWNKLKGNDLRRTRVLKIYVPSRGRLARGGRRATLKRARYRASGTSNARRHRSRTGARRRGTRESVTRTRRQSTHSKYRKKA